MKKNSSIFFITLGIFSIINTELGVVGILPMVSDKYHVTASQAGMLVSSFAFVIALFGPWMTLFFSRFNRKIILEGILFIFAFFNLASIFAPNFYVLLLFRILPAFFHPVYFSLAFTLAQTLTQGEDGAKASAKVFLGVSTGMVLGVPLTSFIASQLSLNFSFLFSAALNIFACIGLFALLPSIPGNKGNSVTSQLSILRKTSVWLHIGTTFAILAAMFSVYSYFSVFLAQKFDMNGSMISLMLVLFGLSGVVGNWYTGRLLSYSLNKTVLIYPVALGVCYLALKISSGLPYILITGLIILWGVIHTSGLIVGQIWLTSAAPESPEFANSLFVSFSNLGVTLGAAAGGWFIAQSGVESVVWGGCLFVILSLLFILAEVWMIRFNKKA